MTNTSAVPQECHCRGALDLMLKVKTATNTMLADLYVAS
jgi:hypothetical protein